METDDVSRLLERVNSGEPGAFDSLVGLVHGELRRMAGSLMRAQPDGHTLQPTALVNEAYLRLVQGSTHWDGKAHFFGAAARAMRQVLMAHARRSATGKRAGDAEIDDPGKRLPIVAADEQVRGFQVAVDHALLNWELEKYDEARTLHTRALAIVEQVAGPDHVDAAASLRGLGIVQNSAGEFTEALESHRRAQPIFERYYGTDHPLVADSLDSLGLGQAGLEQFAEAQTSYQRALDTRKRALGGTHPTVAYSLHNLGRVLVSQGKLEAAVPLYEEGVRIREAALGPDSPFTAALVESLAIVHLRLGHIEQGLPLLERTLHAYQRAYGADHSETVESHRNLVVALTMASRYDEAIVHLREVVLGDVEPRLRMDLKDGCFDPFRSRAAFQKLEAEAGQRVSAGR